VKIFIVTIGDYSDYHIEKVFTDKVKADKYGELMEGKVEEFDTSDTEDFEEYNIITCWYYFKDKEFSSRFSTTIDEKKNLHRNVYNCNPNGKRSIYIQRIYKDSEGHNILDKTKKICEDYAAQIESLIQNESWTPEMIKEWFNTKL